MIWFVEWNRIDECYLFDLKKANVMKTMSTVLRVLHREDVDTVCVALVLLLF